jgi:hypothetical protein
MKRRSLIAVFLLEIVTLGIYSFYWLYRTRLELIAKTHMDIPRLIIPFLPAMVFLVAFILQLTLGFSQASGIVVSLVSIVTFSSVPVFVGLIVWWMWQYSRVVAVATQNTTSQAFTFWIWVLTVVASANIIWFLVMQNKFNQLSAIVPEPAYPGAQPDVPVHPPISAPSSSTWQNIQQTPPTATPPASPQPTDSSNPTHQPEDQ